MLTKQLFPQLQFLHSRLGHPLRFLFSKDYMSVLINKLKMLEHADPSLKQSQVIIEQKNDCVYLRDVNNEFGFMKEVKTQEGSTGVVVDIREKMVGVALYRTAGKVQAVQPMGASAGEFEREQWQAGRVYGVDGEVLLGEAAGTVISVPQLKQVQKFGYNARFLKKKQIPVLNPLLKVTHNINYGDFIVFEGPYGSGRTQTALEIARYFCQNTSPSIVLYLNFNLNNCQKLHKQLTGCNWIAFSESDKQRSDAGGLMLALKTVNLAKRLRQSGHNVLIVIQNMNEIFRREISMLKNFQQPIAGFSVINELFCWTGVPSVSGGNITSIVTLEQEVNRGKNKADAGEVAPTPYVNSLVHMHSLSTPIRFPLELRLSHNPRILARCVNKLIQEEKDYELKSKLKVNTEPWENYFRLDSKWWVNSLKKYRAQDPEQLQLFILFVEWSIENDNVAHWTIPAHQAFKLFKSWLSSRQILFNSKDLEKSSDVLDAFIMHCKIEGVYLPFAKDYLN